VPPVPPRRATPSQEMSPEALQLADHASAIQHLGAVQAEHATTLQRHGEKLEDRRIDTVRLETQLDALTKVVVNIKSAAWWVVAALVSQGVLPWLFRHASS
jgi:hypothetical protein